MSDSLFKTRYNRAMMKVVSQEELAMRDPMIALVLESGRTLFTQGLDQMSPGTLLDIGGKLAGAYGYLAQKAAYARAERDTYEAKLDEMEKELILDCLSEGGYKVTEARARVSAEVAEYKEGLLTAEANKNMLEAIVEASSRMSSYCQSALKHKENERFQVNLAQRGQNNH